MSLSSRSLFAKLSPQSLRNAAYDTFNWMYEHMPFTTPRDPRIAHLPGHPLFGKIPVVAERDGLARLSDEMYRDGKDTPSGVASVRFASETTFLLTKLSHILQIFLFHNTRVDRGKLLVASSFQQLV